MARSIDEVVVRDATTGDAEALSAFRCSTGPWYEQDVEDYLRRRALGQLLATPDTYSLLVALDGKRLVGCMAHYPEGLIRASAALILATRLQVLAIAVTDQGRRLKDGTRLSDALMRTVIHHALDTRRYPVLTTIVAQDNLRSVAVCERNGLRSQIQHDGRHVRLSGHFSTK